MTGTDTRGEALASERERFRDELGDWRVVLHSAFRSSSSPSFTPRRKVVGGGSVILPVILPPPLPALA